MAQLNELTHPFWNPPKPIDNLKTKPQLKGTATRFIEVYKSPFDGNVKQSPAHQINILKEYLNISYQIGCKTIAVWHITPKQPLK